MRPSAIARNYLRTWFIVDAVRPACAPRPPRSAAEFSDIVLPIRVGYQLVRRWHPLSIHRRAVRLRANSAPGRSSTRRTGLQAGPHSAAAGWPSLRGADDGGARQPLPAARRVQGRHGARSHVRGCARQVSAAPIPPSLDLCEPLTARPPARPPPAAPASGTQSAARTRATQAGAARPRSCSPRKQSSGSAQSLGCTAPSRRTRCPRHSPPRPTALLTLSVPLCRHCSSTTAARTSLRFTLSASRWCGDGIQSGSLVG
jgi:hypothetical protein